MKAQKSKIVFLILIVGVCALSLYSYFITRRTYEISLQLGRERLRYEALLAEKLTIEKSLVKAKNQLAALNPKKKNSK